MVFRAHQRQTEEGRAARQLLQRRETIKFGNVSQRLPLQLHGRAVAKGFVVGFCGRFEIEKRAH